MLRKYKRRPDGLLVSSTDFAYTIMPKNKVNTVPLHEKINDNGL